MAGWAATEWDLNFETIGDPHHEISGACRERRWIDLFVNERVEFLSKSWQIQEDLKGRGMQHPKGYLQPGVLAVTRKGTVQYRWRSVPNRNNLGGAMERPTARHVWTKILEHRKVVADGMDAGLDDDPILDSKGPPWPYFVMLALASGWFLKIDGFHSERYLVYYNIRLVLFVLAWVAAFAYFSVLPVAIVLGAWALFVTPKVLWLNKELQNESDSSVDSPTN